MEQLKLIDAADQQFGAIINNRRVTFRFRWNLTSGRWSMDVAIDDLPVATARRVVIGVDLLKQYALGIGKLFALDYVVGADPGRTQLPAGDVRIYHVSDAEYEANGAVSP